MNTGSERLKDGLLGKDAEAADDVPGIHIDLSAAVKDVQAGVGGGLPDVFQVTEKKDQALFWTMN